jgi:hypothetical protein
MFFFSSVRRGFISASIIFYYFIIQKGKRGEIRSYILHFKRYDNGDISGDSHFVKRFGRSEEISINFSTIIATECGQDY